MKTVFFLFISLFFILLLQSCNCEKCEPKCDECPNNTSQTDQNRNTTVLDAFDTYEAKYYPTGFYNKKMMIPTKTWSTGGSRVKLEVEIVHQEDLSIYKDSIYIIFEHFKHNQPYRKPMKDSLISRNYSGNLNILSNFNPSFLKKIYVVSYHDEDFPYKNNSINNAIYSYIQRAIKKCVDSIGTDCHKNILEDSIMKIIKSNKIKKLRPNTLGGGVIPPQ